MTDARVSAVDALNADAGALVAAADALNTDTDALVADAEDAVMVADAQTLLQRSQSWMQGS